MAAKVERLTETELADRTRQNERAAGYSSTYANNVSIAITPWDFKLTFGVVLEATKKLLRMEDRQEIYMSPQHMKTFVAVLTDKVKEYEAAFGEISDPQAERKTSKGAAKPS